MMFTINKSSKTTISFQVLFHIIFWSVWLIMPIINAYFDNDEGRRQHLLSLIPISLTNIPLFFINTEILIPKILQKKGIGKYVISLLLLTAAFGFIQFFMRKIVITHEEFRKTYTMMTWYYRIVFPVLFVSAVSTGFGLISFMLSQEKVINEQKQERLQSELSFLRSQISPHFIFNVLNGIVYLIRKDTKTAEAVTIKLSELLRYMLYDSDTKYVPLNKEMEYLENYIDLQKLRFGEDVLVNYHVSGNQNYHLIEPMLLIPFIENAFKHGIGMIENPEIQIKIDTSGNTLKFSCKNKNCPETVLEKDTNSGIGIKNVQRRLILLYPNAHQLSINEKDGWFNVDLSLHFIH